MKTALVLINTVSENPGKDELDVLDQATAVEKALHELGYKTHREYFGLNLEHTKNALRRIRPDVVFNLVEAVAGKGNLVHLAPSLLESLEVPFTGSGALAMLLTTDKIRTKKLLSANGLASPDWFLPHESAKAEKDRQYIFKPVWEDGSADITDSSIIAGKDAGRFVSAFRGDIGKYFFEAFISGREFNLSVIGGKEGPRVLPPAEMQYLDFPPHKPRILNFASKWEEDSFEYSHTVRTFDIPETDRGLVSEMIQISRRCWDLFEMGGYIRVDFRVDEHNRPWILEVNANPCITPGAGFPAACEYAGLSYTKMIEKILNDAMI